MSPRGCGRRLARTRKCPACGRMVPVTDSGEGDVLDQHEGNLPRPCPSGGSLVPRRPGALATPKEQR